MINGRACLGLVILGAALLPWVSFAGPPASASMQFGLEDVGSPFQQPPEFLHDNSERATDTIVAGAVAISTGGAVDFTVLGFHQVAVYDAGIAPGDIDVSGPGLLIDDPNGRLVLGAPPFVPDPGKDVSYTFTEPGRYLVICTVKPHFVEGRMWGWVQAH